MADDPVRGDLEKALAEQYTILRLLGRGGMGAVYLARDLNLERLVAIKALPSNLADSGEMKERFRREARIAARLSHPNIVPLHAYGETGDLMYFVMGFVRGESLGARMAREPKIPVDETRRILAELAEALDYAHRQGIVHRDVKPDNVMVEDESGRAMLSDFGVAKPISLGQPDDKGFASPPRPEQGALGLTRTGLVLGTPQYMSPEQGFGEEDLDGRSDIFALGVMGYQMVSGRLPFEATDFESLLHEKVSKQPPSLLEIAPDIPEEFSATIGKCLKTSRTERWPDGRSLGDALRRPDDAGPDFPDSVQRFVGKGIPIFLGLLVPTIFLGTQGNDAAPFFQIAISFYLAVWLMGNLWWVRAFRKERFSLRDALTSIYRAPRWWFVWWPRPLREPSDVWSQLPGPLQTIRTIVGLSMAAVFLGIVWFVSPGAPYWFHLVGTFGAIAWGGSLLSAYLYGRSLSNRYGLAADSGAIMRMLREPTVASPFWKRGLGGQVLKSRAIQRAVAWQPQMHGLRAHQHFKAISDLAGQLTGPLREIGSRAVAAARRIVDHLETIESHLNMASNLGVGDRGGAAQSLLQHRDRYHDLLEALRYRLADLCAQEVKDKLAAERITPIVEDLCLEIEAHIEAAKLTSEWVQE